MIKIFTQAEIIGMDSVQYKNFMLSISINAFRLIGLFWKKYIKLTIDNFNGDYVFEYE